MDNVTSLLLELVFWVCIHFHSLYSITFLHTQLAWCIQETCVHLWSRSVGSVCSSLEINSEGVSWDFHCWLNSKFCCLFSVFLSWWIFTDGLQHTSAAGLKLWFMQTPATCNKLHGHSFTKELVHAVMKTLENRTALKQLSDSISLTPSGCFNSLSNADLQTKTAALQSRNIKYLWSKIMYLKLFLLNSRFTGLIQLTGFGISGFKCPIFNF